MEEVKEEDVPADVIPSPGKKLWKCAMEGCIHKKIKTNEGFKMV